MTSIRYSCNCNTNTAGTTSSGNWYSYVDNYPTSTSTTNSWISYHQQVTTGTTSADYVIRFNSGYQQAVTVTWPDTWPNQIPSNYEIRYGFLGDITQKLLGWMRFKDFAPLSEWVEVDSKAMKGWLKKMAEDPEYLRTQLLANIRHDMIHEIEQRLLGGGKYNVNENGIISRINDIIQKLAPVTPAEHRLVIDELKETVRSLRKEKHDILKAQRTSEKLLKMWLSTDEWKSFSQKGELQIKSRMDENTIYIIKKKPEEMVQVVKNGVNAGRLCLVSVDKTLPAGDRLLSKILLLKSDEAGFLKVAIPHPP